MKCDICEKEKKPLFLVFDTENNEEFILCREDTITKENDAYDRDTILGIVVAI